MTAEMDRQQATEALGVSAAAFRELARDPSCPLGEGVKRGRKQYWSRDAVEATRIWEATRRKGGASRNARASTEDAAPKRAAPATATPSEPRRDAQPRTSAPIVDPIALWLDACRNAAALFQQSVDPRRALLLMNPFAPFAAYASFAQPAFLNALTQPAAGGLGVWGVPTAAPRPSPERPSPGASKTAAERAALEAVKLYRCAEVKTARR